jgi:hypothetical protein
MQILATNPVFQRDSHDFTAVGYGAGCVDAENHDASGSYTHCTGTAPNGGVYKKVYVDGRNTGYKTHCQTDSGGGIVCWGSYFETWYQAVSVNENHPMEILYQPSNGQWCHYVDYQCVAQSNGNDFDQGIGSFASESASNGYASLNLNQQTWHGLAFMQQNGPGWALNPIISLSPAMSRGDGNLCQGSWDQPSNSITITGRC